MSVYIKSYDRSMRYPSSVGGGDRARHALEDIVQSMHAITHMMRALLVNGDDQQFLADAVYVLLDQQCAMLNGVCEKLDAEAIERRTEDEAKGIIKHSMVPDENLYEEQHKLRIQFIESNTKAGVHPRTIGGALNLTEDYVGRVIARLRGEAPPRSGRAATRA